MLPASKGWLELDLVLAMLQSEENVVILVKCLTIMAIFSGNAEDRHALKPSS